MGDWRYSSTHSLTCALDAGEWSSSRPGRFTPREIAPVTHWIGGWVGPRAILNAVVKKKIPSPCRESNSRTPIVQPIAQCYTDWAIMALLTCKVKVNVKVKRYISLCSTKHHAIEKHWEGGGILLASTDDKSSLYRTRDTAHIPRFMYHRSFRFKFISLVKRKPLRVESNLLSCFLVSQSDITNIVGLTQFDVFSASKTMLVMKFFRAISRVVWFYFRRYQRFEDHLCLHPQSRWVDVGMVSVSQSVSQSVSVFYSCPLGKPNSLMVSSPWLGLLTRF
jgi:hypothetical protein